MRVIAAAGVQDDDPDEETAATADDGDVEDDDGEKPLIIMTTMMMMMMLPVCFGEKGRKGWRARDADQMDARDGVKVERETRRDDDGERRQTVRSE